MNSTSLDIGSSMVNCVLAPHRHRQLPKSPLSGGLGTCVPLISPFRLSRSYQDFGNLAKVGVTGRCLLISLIHHNSPSGVRRPAYDINSNLLTTHHNRSKSGDLNSTSLDKN